MNEEILMERRSTAFRIFQKMPFRIQASKSPKPSEFIDDPYDDEIGQTSDDEIYEQYEKQLTGATDILKYSVKQIREPGSSSDSSEEEICIITDVKVEESEKVPEESETVSDIYGNLENRSPNEFEEMTPFLSFFVYIAWGILLVFAHFRDFLCRFGLEKEKGTKEREEQKDFVPLLSDFDALYTRKCYIRVRDIFERPIGSCPGATVNLVDRYSDDNNWTYKFPGTQTEVINVSSYNYLGFAQAEGPCAEDSIKAIDQWGIAGCTTVREAGYSVAQHKLEKLVSEFLGVEDAMCFTMGFATNSMNTPSLADKDTLIISDQRNHRSLILGMSLSGAKTMVFEHNDVVQLEQILRDAIVYGNPKTGRPFQKILIVIEGIYSMEGSICPLRDIIALKKKYGAYLYLDEAHSIGAMGATGRGVVEYWGCDVKDVDIMMGTFTKSFGSSGGYIAGNKKIIDHLRATSHAGVYAAPMSPAIAQQAFTSMSIIMGKDGTDDGARRVERLARNSRYFRLKLKQAGYIIYGSDDSPVVPMLLYFPGKCGFWGREMVSRNIGVVVVSYPATEMEGARIRFCLSAAHTKQQLDEVLEKVKEVADLSQVRYSHKSHLYKNLDIEW